MPETGIKEFSRRLMVGLQAAGLAMHVRIVSGRAMTTTKYKNWRMVDVKLVKENLDLPNQTLANMFGVSYWAMAGLKKVHGLTNPNIAPKIYRNEESTGRTQT